MAVGKISLFQNPLVRKIQALKVENSDENFYLVQFELTLMQVIHKCAVPDDTARLWR